MTDMKDIEQAIVGNIIIHNELIDKVVGRLTPEHFSISWYKNVFEAIMNLHDEKKSIDYLTLEDALLTAGIEFDDDMLLTLGDCQWYFESAIKSLEEQFLKRQFKNMTLVLNQEADSPIVKSEDLMLQYKEKMQVLEKEQEKQERNLDEIEEAKGKYIKHLEDNEQTVIKTGFTELDELIKGFSPGAYIILASWSSVGKTTLALNMFRHQTVEFGIPALFISIETTEWQLYENFLSMQGKIDNMVLAERELTKKNLEKMTAAAKLLDDAPIYLDDSSWMDVNKIYAKSKLAVEKYDVKIIYIDYFQLVTPQSVKGRTREQELSVISKKMKEMAQELNVPVIMLAQLRDQEYKEKEQGKQGEPPLPNQYHLRESKSVYHDCDICLMLHRRSYFLEQEDKNKAKIYIRKNKNGMRGAIEIAYYPELRTFANLGEIVNESSLYSAPAEGR